MSNEKHPIDMEKVLQNMSGSSDSESDDIDSSIEVLINRSGRVSSNVLTPTSKEDTLCSARNSNSSSSIISRQKTSDSSSLPSKDVKCRRLFSSSSSSHGGGEIGSYGASDGFSSHQSYADEPRSISSTSYNRPDRARFPANRDGSGRY